MWLFCSGSRLIFKEGQLPRKLFSCTRPAFHKFLVFIFLYHLEWITNALYLCIRFLKSIINVRQKQNPFAFFYDGTSKLICWQPNTYLSLHPLFEDRIYVGILVMLFTVFCEFSNRKIWLEMWSGCIFAVRKKNSKTSSFLSRLFFQKIHLAGMLKNWESEK